MEVPPLEECPMWLEMALAALEKSKEYLRNMSGNPPEGYSLFLSLRQQGFPESLTQTISEHPGITTDILAKELAKASCQFFLLLMIIEVKIKDK